MASCVIVIQPFEITNGLERVVMDDWHGEPKVFNSVPEARAYAKLSFGPFKSRPGFVARNYWRWSIMSEKEYAESYLTR